MMYTINKGKAKPLEPGIYRICGREYYLIGECDCTSPLLHYLLKDSKELHLEQYSAIQEEKKKCKGSNGPYETSGIRGAINRYYIIDQIII